MRKKLVIIAGVTGAVGTALMAEYGKWKDVVMVGISRQGLRWADFISHTTGKLPIASFICSLDALNKEECDSFIAALDFEKFSEIVYCHCVGLYLFEIDRRGFFILENDHDKDGINDECLKLSYHFFRWMTRPLMEKSQVRLSCAIFGSLADRHQPRIIQSWWKAMRKVERYMEKSADKRVTMAHFSISSIFCPHELLNRPYVFVNTEAESQAWLSPFRLSSIVRKYLKIWKGGYHQMDVYNTWSGFFDGFYSDTHMVPRRLAETERR